MRRVYIFRERVLYESFKETFDDEVPKYFGDIICWFCGAVLVDVH